MHIRNSAKALIVQDGRLLAIKKEHEEGDTYYLLVGGGQEHGETLRDAVIRECMEEAGAEVVPGDIVFIREYIVKNHEHTRWDSRMHQMEYMFVCELISGPDLSKATVPDDGQVDIEWLPLEHIEQYPLYPQNMRTHVRDYFLYGKKHMTYLGDMN